VGKVEESGTMHFLHLLGIDTQGHAHRPDSRQYLENIARVDAGIQKCVQLVGQRFANDNATAFIFTSDHGMSDRGSHGAGDFSETETPYVAWGAGIRAPQPANSENVWRKVGENEKAISENGWRKGSPRSWEVDHLERADIHQADLAPLMSALLGLDIPVNSVGRVPVSLLANVWTRVATAQANAAQMTELLRVKAEIRRNASFFFSESPALKEANGLLEQSISENDLSLAHLSFERARAGLVYYDRYFRTFLFSLISAAMAGWLLCLFGKRFSETAPRKRLAENAKFFSISAFRVAQLLVSVIWSAVLVAQKTPLTFPLYIFFAVFLLSEGVRHVTRRGGDGVLQSLSFRQTLAEFVFLQCVVLGFFWRPVFFLLLLFFSLYVWLAYGDKKWAGTVFLASFFPLISPTFGGNDKLAFFGGVVWAIFSAATAEKEKTLANLANGLPVLLCCAAAANVLLNLKAVSWSVTVLSFASYFFFFQKKEKKRLILCVAPVIVLLSINYESLFLFLLFLCVKGWRKNNSGGAENISGVIFLLFSYGSFFGTGNEGSLSSFEISSTYRFATVFSPFLMGTLLVAKCALPIVVVGETFAKITRQKSEKKDSSDALLKLVGMSNVLAFSFFFLIRDEGSWRDIGLSISHFVIANVQTLLALFFFLLWEKK
jgi:phosphatidylinositol glycan class N